MTPSPWSTTGTASGWRRRRAFVAAYEAARGAPFTREQWRGVSAAALYATSYGARCEHALGLSAAEGRCSRRLAQTADARYFRV
jgi:hypothetical protein